MRFYLNRTWTIELYVRATGIENTRTAYTSIPEAEGAEREERKKTQNLISELKWRWTCEANWFLFGMCSLSWRLHDWLCWFNLNLIFRFFEGIDFVFFIFVPFTYFVRATFRAGPARQFQCSMVEPNVCYEHIKLMRHYMNGITLRSLTPFDWF